MRATLRLSDRTDDSRVAPRAFEIASSMFDEDARFLSACYETTDEDCKHLVPVAKVVVRIGRREVMTKERTR